MAEPSIYFYLFSFYTKSIERQINEQDKREEKFMNKIMDFLEEKLVPVAAALGSNRYLKAISGGFIAIMSVTIVGSLFTLLCNLPITAYTNWLKTSGFGTILALPSQATIDLIALYAVFFIAYNLAREFEIEGTAGAGLAALVSFMLITGRTEDGTYATTYLGAKGLFCAMFVALVAARIYVFVVKRGWVIRLPESVPPNVANSFSALIPTGIVISVFLAIAGLMTLTSYHDLHTAVFTIIQSNLMKFMGDSLPSFLFFNLATNLLWFFGLHGGNIIGSITNPIYTPLALENFALYEAGQAPTHIISGSFGKCFTSGGVGSMFSLAIIMVLFAKSEQFKTLGKLALPTTMFFINEPLLFGIPIVLNPMFFIPLLLTTPILGSLTYFVMKIGFIPIPSGAQIPWTTPPVLYGILQGSWKIALWEVFMIFLAGCIWFPFFKVADKKAYEQEQGINQE